MGGRGSSSGGGAGGGGAGGVAVGGGGGAPFGGHGSLQGLIGAMQQSGSGNGSGKGNGYNNFHAGEGNSTGDYNDNNNPALLKWQNQSDDTKAARYLAKLGKQATPAADAEGYSYHQSAFQNMVIDQNLNAPVYAKLSASQFSQYCKANGLQPFYRGWSSGSSMARFENAAASHTGAGMYGEGYYFGDRSTASSYARGSDISVAALSPAARVVDLDVVRSAIAKSGISSALARSGVTMTSNYGNNQGEAQMALKMGYNVIRTDWSYVVLTRDAVVIRK